MADKGQEQPDLTKDIHMPDEAGPVSTGCVLYAHAISDGAPSRSHRLERGEAIIGREKGCELIIDDASVSRKHVRLQVRQDGIVVEDLGSLNGTTYLGKRIERAVLQPGSRIKVGNCEVDLLPVALTQAVPISPLESYVDLQGRSIPMRRLYSVLQMLEKSEAPILIEGETGTGKEVVARALHEKGLRAGKPMVVIDCGNVPRDLMESELFGHRKGSFTGAVADRAGAFEMADGGTVFLDELGELPIELQPKLLRVLEARQVRRIGDAKHLPVNVRIIAATQRDLDDEVAAGRFRQDLFYRVAVVRLKLPPLRERRDDIPILAAHLAEQVSEGATRQLPADALELFLNHDWPGNVRELRNAVQRTLSLGLVGLGTGMVDLSSEAVASAPVGSPVPGGEAGEPEPYRDARERAMRDFEIQYLTNLWAYTRGNLSAASRIAGIDRKYIRNLLKKYRLNE